MLVGMDARECPDVILEANVRCGRSPLAMESFQILRSAGHF